jgi:hypothetical protein
MVGAPNNPSQTAEATPLKNKDARPGIQARTTACTGREDPKFGDCEQVSDVYSIATRERPRLRVLQKSRRCSSGNRQ